MSEDYRELEARLRGVYTVPVNDGGGLLDGKDTFTRTFDNLPAIQGEAADALADLRAQRDKAWADATVTLAAIVQRAEQAEAALAAEREAHERTKAELVGVYAEMGQLHLTHKKELADAQAEAQAMRRERNQEIAALVAVEDGVEQRIYGALDEAAKENQAHCDHIVKLEAALARADALLREMALWFGSDPNVSTRLDRVIDRFERDTRLPAPCRSYPLEMYSHSAHEEGAER